MAKRRMRLGSGLDAQKLRDTIDQVYDSFEELPQLTLDVHGMDDGWLHLAPEAGQSDTGELTKVIGWLMTFGFPYDGEPLATLAQLGVDVGRGYMLASWEVGMYASLWLPSDTSVEEIAVMMIAVVQKVLGVSDDAHVEVALEFG